MDLNMPTARQLIIDLRRKREEIQRELKKINFTIEFFDRVGDTLGDTPFPQNFLIDPEMLSRGGQIAAEEDHATPAEIVAAVTEILRHNGRPMTRSQIASALKARGLVLAGRDINKNVGTILWRNSQQFVNLPKLGYWLADVAIPDIYEPAT